MQKYKSPPLQKFKMQFKTEGECDCCGKKFSGSAMTNHLAKCPERKNKNGCNGVEKFF